MSDKKAKVGPKIGPNMTLREFSMRAARMRWEGTTPEERSKATEPARKAMAEIRIQRRTAREQGGS